MSEVRTQAWPQCTILVTGGNGDIGSALVAQLRALGARVVITSRQPAQHDQQALPWDMADPESTDQLMRLIKQRQLNFNMLVHCAHQFSPAQLILQVSPDTLQQSLITNLVPLYQLMRYLARGMYRQKFGRMLLLGSYITECGGAGKLPYIMEKSAFNGMVRGFNAEFASHGVISSVLHPAIVDTTGIRERVTAEVLQQAQANNPQQRMLRVDEVVQACLPLLDPTRPLCGSIAGLSGGVPC